MLRGAALFLVFLACAGIADCRRADPTKEKWEEGQANATKADAAKAAREAKMAGVNKVVSMLKDLQSQVVEEGEAEATTYNEFACFCKDGMTEKTESIKTGGDSKTDISAVINQLTTDRNTLDTKINTLVGEIEVVEENITKAEAKRAATLAEFEKNAADLSASIAGLDGAIKTLKSSKAPGLLQLQAVSKTLNEASVMADALGLDSATSVKRVATVFLQGAPDVPMEDYKFKSGDIISTLETLRKDFETEKQDVDKEEAKSVAEHEAYMQEKTTMKKLKTKEMKDAKKKKSQKQEQIASNSEQLTTVSATLLDDQEYLKELSRMCNERAVTWDQRSRVRSDELSAITSAITIVEGQVTEKTSAATIRFAQRGVSVRLAEEAVIDNDAMEELEAEAEDADAGAAVSFLQKLRRTRAHRDRDVTIDDGREQVITLFRSKGAQLKSTLLISLASTIGADPFAKIKQLISETIQRLLQEAANEADQKGWCDKGTSDAKQSRDNAAQEIQDLNDSMATLESLRDKLVEELSVLDEEITELKSKQTDAEKLRNDEKAESETTVAEAEAGLSAVKSAISVLEKFYASAAKEKVDTSLIQSVPDMPDAGFKSGEAYQGAQGTSGGIVGMLEVIESDFVRTISETKKSEAAAVKEYRNFKTESGMSLAEKEMAETEKKKQRDGAKTKLSAADDDLDSQVALLQGAVEELIKLKAVCQDTGMSYEERVAAREDELESLKKGLCILEAVQEYGPDGAGGQC